jgi:hypothetical protein
MLNPCRSNLLPILITLLSCAGLFIFFNLRLNELKITVEKQNRVLTSFITNVQQDIKASGGAAPQATEPTKHFAAPEALIAARRQEIDKIVVSDDEEDSESDSESESDSDSDSESDGEDANDIKVVNLQRMPSMSFEPVSFEPVSFEPVSFEVLSCVNLSNESSIASESSITEIIEEPTSLEPLNLESSSLESSSLEPLNLESLNLVNLIGKTDETTTVKSDSISYDQMKVDDLRKIVTDKNLSTKEEVKKLKKPELLVLLKK